MAAEPMSNFVLGIQIINNLSAALRRAAAEGRQPTDEEMADAFKRSDDATGSLRKLARRDNIPARGRDSHGETAEENAGEDT